jgi:hypothetical protein
MTGKGNDMRRINVIFELSMPNCGSRNGKWTGAGRKYTVIRKLEANSPIIGKYFLYQWNDGWCARVDARKANREKPTNEFRMYEWMIDSIIQHGEIRPTWQGEKNG